MPDTYADECFKETSTDPGAFKSAEGFTLVEMVIAVGLVSIVTLAIAQVVVEGMYGQKRTDLKGAIAATRNQIVNVLGNSDLCLRAFEIAGTSAPNRIGSPTSYPHVLNVQSLRVSQGGNVSPIVTTGSDLVPGLRVQRIQLALETDIGLMPDPATGPNRRISGQVVVEYNSTNPSINLPLRPESFPILLTVDTTSGGAIVSCSPSSGLTEQLICENLFNGIYDPLRSTNRCMLQGFSYSTGVSLRDMGLNGTNTVSVPSGGRGFSVYGAGSQFTLYASQNDFIANSNGSSISKNAGDLLLATPGTVRALGNFNSSGAISAVGNMTTAGSLSAAGNGSVGGTLTVGNSLNLTGNLVNVGGTASGFAQISASQMNANTFVTPSDSRLKENIEALRPQLESVQTIKTYTYNYKTDPLKRSRIGVLAQEIEALYPQVVVTDPKTNLKSVNYQELVPVLIHTIQELNDKMEFMEKQIEALQSLTVSKLEKTSQRSRSREKTRPQPDGAH